jgi:hypothetical protein
VTTDELRDELAQHTAERVALAADPAATAEDIAALDDLLGHLARVIARREEEVERRINPPPCRAGIFGVP